MKQVLGSIFPKEKTTKEYKVNIPDEDMVNWVKILREGGFSEEEVDNMMVYLNNEYAQAKGDEVAGKKMEEVVAQIKQGYNHVSSKEERQKIKEDIKARFKQ